MPICQPAFKSTRYDVLKFMIHNKFGNLMSNECTNNKSKDLLLINPVFSVINGIIPSFRVVSLS